MLPSDAWAQCASSDRSEGQNVGYDAIRLVPQNMPGSLMGQFRNGYDSWNNAACGAADAFPHFTETWPGAGRTVTVLYHTGFSARNPQSCGQFAGNTVNVYEEARDANGNTISCSAAGSFQDTIAHELGHLLGLRDQYSSSCNGYAMSQRAYSSSGAYVDRSIKSSECTKVATTNRTPQEQQDEACAADPNLCDWCDPRDDTCDSPVVLDLGDSGFSFSSIEKGVLFDLDADGIQERTAWTTGKSPNLFLVLDRNENGIIDNGSELFGSATRFQNGDPAQNGYQALFELDVVGGNENGYIDPGDNIFDRLRLWHDRNHNGKSEADELVSLRKAGVEAISVEYRISMDRDPHGNYLQARSHAYLVDERGERRKIDTVDVFFLIDDPDIPMPGMSNLLKENELHVP